MTKGILLVANLKSQAFCSNLIYSIRSSGCNLPIRLIHFGGEAIDSQYIFDQVEFLEEIDFSNEAKQLIQNLQEVLTDCPKGFLYRFLGWYLDWDSFIYADNDIVALDNWDTLFNFLRDADFVHADQEYMGRGIYEYKNPDEVAVLFGERTFSSAFNAGFFVASNNDFFKEDFVEAINWFKENHNLPKNHDQALMNIASLIGDWKTLNLCKSPHSFLSTWSFDYKNSLDIINKIQSTNKKVIFLHYAGYTPKGYKSVDELLISELNEKQRLLYFLKASFVYFKEHNFIRRMAVKIWHLLAR